MRVTCLAMTGALLFAIAPTGCATVIGLDSGHPVADDGGDPQDTGEASSSSDASAPGTDAGTSSDAGVTNTCAPLTGDCNDDPKDGCETLLNTPQHCGSCTNACTPGRDCSAAGDCCSGPNQVCVLDSDCCSGQCQNAKCKGGGPGPG